MRIALGTVIRSRSRGGGPAVIRASLRIISESLGPLCPSF